VQSSDDVRASDIPSSDLLIGHILKQGKGLDLVGIFAAGRMFRGFANSFGQKNWYDSRSFNVDFSLYLRADKAVTTNYAGFQWDHAAFDRLLSEKTTELALLDAPVHVLNPGAYRAYLGPMAVNEITDMMCWGGFSYKGIKTKTSPLTRLAEGSQALHPTVSFREATAEGVDPQFNPSGFIKPKVVELINSGTYTASLVSPRSAKEYGITSNGASGGESPQSLDMAAGHLRSDAILKELDTGIYINNLWYLNFSDRPAGRVTGMTRFAAFWVEGGRRVAPLAVMRFDDSIYRVLGSNLLALTEERQFLLSSSTYGARQTSSVRLPGALVKDFNLTL
jgi:predicted Zn-dependent protease